MVRLLELMSNSRTVLPGMRMMLNIDGIHPGQALLDKMAGVMSKTVDLTVKQKKLIYFLYRQRHNDCTQISGMTEICSSS
jgi:hypothetical protein